MNIEANDVYKIANSNLENMCTPNWSKHFTVLSLSVRRAKMWSWRILSCIVSFLCAYIVDTDHILLKVWKFGVRKCVLAEIVDINKSLNCVSINIIYLIHRDLSIWGKVSIEISSQNLLLSLHFVNIFILRKYYVLLRDCKWRDTKISLLRPI